MINTGPKVLQKQIPNEMYALLTNLVFCFMPTQFGWNHCTLFISSGGGKNYLLRRTQSEGYGMTITKSLYSVTGYGYFLQLIAMNKGK